MAKSEKEKKQLIVMGALMTVMVGVGAFSFLGGSKPTAPAKAVAKETSQPVENRDYADESGVKEGIRKYAGPEFPERDPFNIPGGLGAIAANTAAAGPAPKPIGGGPGPRATSGGAVPNTSGLQPMRPDLTPMGGELDPTATTVGNTQPTAPTKETEFKPTPEDPGLSVVGVVKGDVPTAILQDHGGKQFLVKLGSEAFDARLIAVASRHVVIEYGGKQHILHLAR
ncbi:MAG: hypothetical protein JNJ45_10505 [Chthonomonas sp.]|nr:hypothetical protein [Chthonomonas sp.]